MRESTKNNFLSDREEWPYKIYLNINGKRIDLLSDYKINLLLR